MHPTIPAVSAAAVPPDALLLDVREPHEWAAGHAPQALHVPMGRIPASLPGLPRDREVVVVCHSGVRSAQVTAWLNEQGYACRNLTGGMVAYAATGGPLTSENGQPPVVDWPAAVIPERRDVRCCSSHAGARTHRAERAATGRRPPYLTRVMPA